MTGDYCLTYLGEVLDILDSREEAEAARRDLYDRVRRNLLPDFLDADDVESIHDFGIRPAESWES